MAGTGKKWAIGCGIGCGVMLLVLALLVGGGIFAGKRIASRVEGVEESMESMSARFGQPESFTPPLDGRIPPDRMETFFAAREDMFPHRADLGRTLNVLDGEEGNVLDKVRAGIRLIPSLMDFIEDRNRAMMDAGMGLGEYQYIYALLAFGLLDKDPADGPGFTLVSDEEDDDDSWHFRTDGGEGDEEEIRERRAREVRKIVNRFQVGIMENHLAALEDDFANLEGLDREDWKSRLVAELESMKYEQLKLMWEDGLPDHVRDALIPYQTRFEESYDPMTSVLEMGLVDFND